MKEQMNYVKDFSEKMDALFRAYQNDGCMENYSYKYVEKDCIAYFTVGMKDNEYVYSALDGALHIYRSLNEGSRLVLNCCGSTETTETFSIG